MADQIDSFLEAIGEKGNKFIENRVRNSPKTKFEDDNLISVDLSNLGIISLYPEMLEVLSGVKEIDLSDNMLEFIPEGLFAPLSGIKTISLKGNPIYTYHPKAFDGLDDLEHLDLSETQVFYLNPEIFNQMPNLKSIDLSGTKLPHHLQGRHTDIQKLKADAEKTEYERKAPSKLYFWKNLTFSYLAILCFIAIPITALAAGNSLNAIVGILLILGFVFLALDFGVIKRHVGAKPKLG